ncbi:MAG: carboxylating nicotinate-nucleotide diphosphorylase [Planctomycetes bacterium]|nr:carboxylating nicotinate-nucleotide diphosphorylase [Planctomycetota bacterium]
MKKDIIVLPINIKKAVRDALKEDVGSGDITSETFIPSNVTCRGDIVVKEDAYLCGIYVAQEVFKQVDQNLKFKAKHLDGAFVSKGTVVASVFGKALSILKGERLSLNFLQRLSGISTFTRKFVNKVDRYGVQILDTRKTTPNWRYLERYAVRIGGGENHRFDLSDAVIIKDNHLRAIKNFQRLKGDILKLKKKVKFVEIEAQNHPQAIKFTQLPVDVMMFDNFEVSQLKKIVKIVRKKRPDLILEASGGIKLHNVEKYAKCGVDWISIGAITHSYKSINFCLDLIQ